MKNIFFKLNFLFKFFKRLILLLLLFNFNFSFTQTKRLIVEVNSQGPFFSSGYRTIVNKQQGISILIIISQQINL